jgi:hypothetical protein
MKHRVVITLVVATAIAAPTSATAAVLYDQSADPAPDGAAANRFQPPSTFDAMLADDFTVPTGQTWRITSVDVFTSMLLAPLDSGSIFIFADTGGQPGATLFNQNGIAPFAPGASVAQPVTGAPSLKPGTYWLSEQPVSSGSTQWFWATIAPQRGAAALWKNPGNGYGSGCTTYKPLSQCGFAPSQVDAKFRLNGDDVSKFTLGKVKSKRNGTATVEATFLAAGGVQIAGATGKSAQTAAKKKASLIKTSTVQVAAGLATLKIKPSKKAKQKLKLGKRVKAKVNITFTPAGGAPNTQSVKVTLKKS